MICPYCRQESDNFKPKAYAAKTTQGLYYVKIFSDTDFAIHTLLKTKEDCFSYAKNNYGVSKEDLKWDDKIIKLNCNGVWR